MTTTIQAPATAAAAEELLGRLFLEGVGAFHLGTVYIGLKHGLFQALVDHGPIGAADLAGHLGLDEWYVREWLQAEATAGLVQADGEDLRTARFTAAAGVHEVLVEATGSTYLGGLPLAVASAFSVMPRLLDVFRTGAGIPYAAYGADAVDAQAALNRPAFVNDLVSAWIPQLEDVAARLADQSRPTRVADVGCGLGWAAIELATAYPHISVDGYDSDEDSIARARANAVAAGVSDRVRFEVVDAASSYGTDAYDLVLFFECVHDMAYPALALARAREALAPGGTVIVMDERISDTLTPGDPTQTFFAAASVLWCLPQGRVEPDSEAIGTVIRPDRLREVAVRAGWSGVDVLGIDHPSWRFYRLVA